MTITFPAVAPSEHPTILAGRFPHVEKRSTGGRVRRIGLSNVQLDGEITLTYANIDTEQLLKLRTHWILARGTTLEFALPAELFPSMSPTTRARLLATTWRHKEPPKVVDICGGQPGFLLHSLEFTLVAQPRRVASPVDPTAPTLSLPVVPVTAPGAQMRLAVAFAPGKAGIDEIKLPGAAWVLSPVWLPGAAGTPSNINALGADWAVSVEIGAGPRTTPSAALNITTTWATGNASVGGVAPGAALATSVMWAPGAASVSLLRAPGTTLATSVAWAPGGASITGGTAPTAALALGIAWQPGPAQSIGPGAAWSVSMVWVGGAGSVPGAGDPSFSSVSLLLKMDGNTFTDSSSAAHAITVSGNANISTAQSKYGGASGYFDGANGTYIQTPANSAFALGTGDFTVEFYVYRTSGRIDQGIFTFGGTASGLFAAMDNANLEIGVNGGGTPQITGGTINLNTWHHVAIARSSGSLRAFIDGVQFGGTVSDSSDLTDNRLSIGYSYQPVYSMVGYLDEFRLTKGVARYTSNFTPTGPHPTS